MRTKLFLLIFFSIFFLSGINAQRSGKITITGTVFDLYEKPIPNAIILIDNQKTLSLTDSAGKYTVKVKPTSLKIGWMTFGNGYYEEEINNRTNIDINFSSVAKVREFPKRAEDIDPREAALQGRNKEGEMAINLGYSYIKRKYLASDIDFIDATENKYVSYSNVQEMILRNVSGMMQIGDKIVLRTSKNLLGYVEPLVMIDGVYGTTRDLLILSPVTIESVAVMKSAYIFGSRGYGGAIVVTTKLSD